MPCLGRRSEAAAYAAAQNRSDAGDQLPELAWFRQVIVGPQFKPYDAVDRARGRREHNDGNAARLLEGTDDRQPVLLRHVEVEDDEFGLVALERLPQAGSAVA